ncbi:MAG: CHAT domain-containing protein [Gemmatimonadaceae bacterium]
MKHAGQLSTLNWGLPVALSANVGRDCASFRLGKPDGHCGEASRSSQSVAAPVLENAIKATHGNNASSPMNVPALVDTWYARDDSMAAKRAVASLRQSVLESPNSVENWNDLSAGLMLRHAANGELLDLVEALHAARQALNHDATSINALWNRAVALTWLGMREGQQRAWSDYSRASGQAAPKVDLAGDALHQSKRDAALQGQWIEASRAYLWRALLPQWGRQVINRDLAGVAASESELDRIVANSSDVDVVDSPSALRAVIRSAMNETQRRELADGFVAMGELRDAIDRSDWAGAKAALSKCDSPTFRHFFLRWLHYEHANIKLLVGDTTARSEFKRLIVEQATKAPVVARRALWGTALSHQSAISPLVAVHYYEQLIAQCARANEEECSVGARAMEAGAHRTIGNPFDAAANLAQALQLSLTYPATQRRWTTISQLRQLAMSRSMSGALADLDYELDQLAQQLNRVDLQLLAVRQQAAQFVRDEQPSADAAVREFADLWHTKASRTQQAEYHADLLWLQGDLARKKNLDSSMTLLDSAVLIGKVIGNRTALFPMLLSRAKTASQRGDTAWALAELDSVLASVRAQFGVTASVLMDARIAETTRAASSDAARMLMATGRTVQALNALSGRAFSKSQEIKRPPSGIAAVAMREIGDSLVMWYTSDQQPGTRIASIRISALRALALRRDSASLARMHDALVRPWATSVKSDVPQKLRLDVRGVAATIPWSALRDSRTGRYLLEDYEITVVNDAFDSTAITPSSLVGESILIVDGVPRKGPRRLPGALLEIDSIKRIWGTSATSIGATEAMTKLTATMDRSRIVHFVGHAEVDATQPERSALLLLGDSMEVRLPATAMKNWRLPHVELMILAACDTRVAGDGAFGGLESLAGVLRSVGVKNVIAAGWPVEDEATSFLMQALHRELARGFAPAAALRNAQLILLHSADPTRNAPRVWAAFQLLGS